MAKNRIENLRDHLFEQLEKLNDDSLVSTDLRSEIDRAKAMSGLAKEILQSSKIEIEFMKVVGGRDTNTDFIQINQNAKQLGE